jgi:hypothetical protein
MNRLKANESSANAISWAVSQNAILTWMPTWFLGRRVDLHLLLTWRVEEEQHFL